MKRYWGFGLKIASEIEFPELLPADFADADVTISIAGVPEKIEGQTVINKAFSSATSEEYLLTVKNICKYYAGFGNTIIAEPSPGIDEHSIRLFLLGTVIAAILYQRGSIPLHASAIIKNDRLVLFAGNSGAGKSTLLASLAAKGYDVFTDDICVLHHNNGANEVYGTASYPMIKLWEDAIRHLGNDKFNKDFKIRPSLPKYGQFFYDTFNTQALPVDKVFILAPKSNIDTISIHKLVAVQAFKEIGNQAYRHRLMSGTKLRSSFFLLGTHIANEVPLFKVYRPFSGTGITLLSDEVEKLL
jgi:hypothetical protein